MLDPWEGSGFDDLVTASVVVQFIIFGKPSA